MREPLLWARFSAGYLKGREVLSDFDIRIERGEIQGLVGESGSGKSTVALALMRLLEFRGGWAHGEIRLDGQELLSLPERRMREIRGREAAFVMQSPMSSLNPSMRIGAQIRECARAHSGKARGDAAPDPRELLEMVNLPSDDAFLARYPRQLSVGQAQRVLIAMAALHRPKLLIADEPTSALDAVNQAGTLRLFSKLSRELGMSVLFISHDLLSVASLCNRISILEKGAIVETGTAREIFMRPRHPYTQSLLAAIPRPAFLDGASQDAGASDKASLSKVNPSDSMSAGYGNRLSNDKKTEYLVDAGHWPVTCT